MCLCVCVCLRGVCLYLFSECVKSMEGTTGTIRVQVSNHFSSAISMNINEVKVRLTLTFCRRQPFLVCDTVSVALLPAVILSSGELCLRGCGVVMLVLLVSSQVICVCVRACACMCVYNTCVCVLVCGVYV